ncbi:ABC transporter permease [Spiroplasma taiwanense]|uniref:Uncharacterized protein n=1 Tax=Spiroplasma taiwanense CT-1 TaxID=1276220 RepID=S5LW38_9MOLU|nr:ABC transporter permease [Spiroplasma taiwanense]AGR40811.1 hypothetical protein STAIW_v1c01250 [Spiroplasma taiwanense CT-1]
MNNIEINQNESKINLNAEIKLQKKNGIRILYLINLKRIISNKGIIATSLVFLIIALIFNIICSSFLKRNDTVEIGIIVLSIGFFFELFTFVIFLTIASVDLIKKQMLDGIQHIETRSGIPMWKSFLLRYLVFLTITEGIAFLNLFISVIVNSAFIWKFNLISTITWSKLFFYILFILIWTPIVFLVTTICSISGSVILNIFLGIIIIMSSFFSSMVSSLFSPDEMQNSIYVMKKNLKLDITNSFYNSLKNDQNINEIFNDVGVNEKSLIFNKLNDKFIALNLTNFNLSELSYLSVKSNLNDTNFQSKKTLIKYSLYGGMPNISLNPYIEYLEENTNLAARMENETFLLEGIPIFNILNDIYNTVNANMKSDNNKPPVNKPGYIGGVIIQKNQYESKATLHDLKPIIEWLTEQETTSKYSLLLDWVLKAYNTYADSLSLEGTKYSSSDEESIFPIFFAENFDWKKTFPEEINIENDYNNQLSKVYKRYPELLILNWFTTQSWLNTMTSMASLKKISWSQENNYANEEETYRNYQILANNSILKNNINIFQYFGTLYLNLFGSGFKRDYLLSNSPIMYSGLTSGYKNYLDLAKVDLRKNQNNNPLTPIFNEISLKRKFGSSPWLAYLSYFIFSIILIWLAYLAYKRKSRI